MTLSTSRYSVFVTMPGGLGRYISQVAELGRRQRAPFNRNQVLGHHPPPCAPVFQRTLPRRMPNMKMYFIMLVGHGRWPTLMDET
jgi:hypothetical protein